MTPKGFGSIIDSFLYEQKHSGSVSPHVTNSSASVTQTSSSVKQSSLLEKQPQVSSSIQSPTRVTQLSGSQTSTGQGSQITALATQSSPDGERSPTKSVSKDSKSTATPDSLGTASTVNTAFCPYHRTKSHDLENCQKFRDLNFSEQKDFLFKKGFCFNCASSNKHISKHCDKSRPQCKICGRSHVTAHHDPSRPENNSSQASSACTRVCKDGPRRSCARIILLKVSDQSDPLKETLPYAVLDDQSTDVFITDALQSKLNLSGAEVNLQVNTIVGTNTVRMRRVPGLQIQDINGEYSPVKVPYAYAQPKIPASHSDIATPDIVRQWDHLKDVADEIHYRSDIESGMLIGRNVPTAFQSLKVIYGEADEPWAERYKFRWTIIGPVCLYKAKSQECSSVSVNRVTVQREELPDSCILNVPQASNPLHRQDSVAVLVNKLQSKDVTNPQIIREMMELDYRELNYSRNEQEESIEDKGFFHIMTAEMHKKQLGNWEVPLPFKTDEVNLPDNRDQCLRRLLSLKRKLCKDERARENYIAFMQKILERQHASRVPDKELTPTPGKVWYLPHFDVYHPKKPDQVRVVFNCSALYNSQSLNKNLLQGPDQLNSLIGVLTRFRKEDVALTCDVEQMFHSFHVTTSHRDLLRFLWFENNDLDGAISEFRMNVHLFGAVSSPAVANYSLHETAETGRAEFGDKAADFLCRNLYVNDGLRID